jgi:hypothetical protein
MFLLDTNRGQTAGIHVLGVMLVGASICPPAAIHTRLPGWFTDSRLIERSGNPHHTAAYCQDFEAIATRLASTADAVPDLRTNELTKENLRS